MKQIYNFEKASPPAIRTNDLVSELERCRTKRATAIIAFVGMLLEATLLILGIILIGTNIILAAAVFSYVFAGGTGVVIVVLTAHKKRRFRET